VVNKCSKVIVVLYTIVDGLKNQDIMRFYKLVFNFVELHPLDLDLLNYREILSALFTGFWCMV
jgi:hypothetical protein